jgi:transcriptional regulator with XRE-family HTH domain
MPVLQHDDRAFLKAVGAALRAERVRQGKRQEDIAVMLGFPYQTISYMERGRQNIPLPTYLSWCDTLGVEPWELIGWR